MRSIPICSFAFSLLCPVLTAAQQPPGQAPAPPASTVPARWAHGSEGGSCQHDHAAHMQRLLFPNPQPPCAGVSKYFLPEAKNKSHVGEAVKVRATQGIRKSKERSEARHCAIRRERQLRPRQYHHVLLLEGMRMTRNVGLCWRSPVRCGPASSGRDLGAGGHGLGAALGSCSAGRAPLLKNKANISDLFCRKVPHTLLSFISHVSV